MATGNYVFDEVDDHEEYLVVLAKEAKEALLDRKVKEMQKKNRDILKRHAEVEADRKAAEDSGCAVNLKSNQQSQSDHCEMQIEAPKLAEEDIARHRGEGQSRGRGRPRASRYRPGHYGQGSMRDNHATESDLLEGKDSDKRLSPSYAGNEKHLPTGDWDTGPPPSSSYSSASHPLENQPPNGGQKSREPSRGQRVMTGRGHSRGQFAKFVTVPDASHSHDVRHVEEVNNSIVINIDRSNRLGGDSMRRGGGGRGGSGYSIQHNPTGELFEDSSNIRDQELGVLPPSDNAQHQKSGYQGQGRRPFRGHGDGPFRGRGESSFRGQGRGDKFRRGRGDGPRPFRGGYRADRPRGGRASRRAVIVTSKSERGDSSQQVEEPEDWDKIVPAGATAVEAGVVDGHGWTNSEDGSANWDESEGTRDPDKREVIESGNSCKESHKELDLHEGEEVANQDQPEERDLRAVEQSENHSCGMGDQPKTSMSIRDESISTQAEHSPGCTKPHDTRSMLPMDATKVGLGIHDVEKLTEKPSETLSASSSNTETNVESKPRELNTVSKAAEVDKTSSCDNDSRDLMPEKVTEAANGESNYAVKPSNVEVGGRVNLSSIKSDSLSLVLQKDVSTDLERPDHEMSSSKPPPSVSAAAAEFAVMSIQPESPANVLIGESISAEPQSPNNGLVEKSAVSSEIPASVKEKT